MAPDDPLDDPELSDSLRQTMVGFAKNYDSSKVRECSSALLDRIEWADDELRYLSTALHESQDANPKMVHDIAADVYVTLVNKYHLGRRQASADATRAERKEYKKIFKGRVSKLNESFDTVGLLTDATERKELYDAARK